jgi:hypothetical protein
VTLYRNVLCNTKYIGVQVIDPYHGLAEVQSAHHLTRNAQLRPYGSVTLAVTAALALVAAALQSLWVNEPSRQMAVYLTIWIASATVSLTVICVDALARARRAPQVQGMATVLLALGQFMPAMGVPFGIGQRLAASILRFGYQDADAAP